MQKIMFNERYGLQTAVLEGRKTQTRREPFYCDKKNDLIDRLNGKGFWDTNHYVIVYEFELV